MQFIFIYGNDRVGRSLVWVRCNSYLPDLTSQAGVTKFLTYSLDKSLCNMKRWADQYIFIFDLEGVGYKNLDIN
jgi:hypothetical protein